MNVTGRNVPVHYMRPNHASWTPPAVISFDTETITTMDGQDEVMTLRLWCARFSDRRAPKRQQPVDDFDHGTMAEDMAVTIHHWTRRRKCVWAYAHNLGFDLTTSDLVPNLMRLGWEVTEFAVNSGAPFVRMRNNGHHITLSDSWSWFQAPLETVAEAVGMRKVNLPEQDDSDAVWLERCKTDVDILHTAMLELMDWWDEESVGNWNITGSASGWNAMRHIPSTERILIRPDDDECDHDRTAIYGGRRTVWQAGLYMYGNYTEIDIEKAYTTACRYLPLPTGRQARFASLPLDHRWLSSDRWGIIAECTVRTAVARYPVRIGGAVWYPVGRFTTNLATPDITEASKHSELERIGPGWLHRLGYALAPWAAWCIDSMRDDNTTVPAVARLVHKVWARSAVGKFGQRGFEVLHIGPSPNGGWDYEEAWHHGKNVPAGIVDFGGERYQVAAVSQSDNAYPAVLAFVESYVRVALGRAIDIVGDGDMVCCDTDGYIGRNPSPDTMRSVNEAIRPFKARPKRRFTRIRVIGPQHLELDKFKRTSGIPASAVRKSDGKLHANTWPKMAWQLANGRQGAYVRPHQEYKLAATYAPGWVLTDGTVVPIELELDDQGANRIVPFPLTRYGQSGAILAPDQNRRLEQYRDTENQTRN